MTQEEIFYFLKERLAKFKLPREVAFLSELPKNAVGKILRRELKERESAGHG